jgi:hypothetical protein
VCACVNPKPCTGLVTSNTTESRSESRKQRRLKREGVVAMQGASDEPADRASRADRAAALEWGGLNRQGRLDIRGRAPLGALVVGQCREFARCDTDLQGVVLHVAQPGLAIVKLILHTVRGALRVHSARRSVASEALRAQSLSVMEMGPGGLLERFPSLWKRPTCGSHVFPVEWSLRCSWTCNFSPSSVCVAAFSLLSSVPGRD